MHSQALRFSLTVFFFLLAAMLLVDVVISAFWRHHLQVSAETSAHIWAVQPLVVVYIVVNALIFSLLFFFRFSAQVSRPLQALTATAQQPHDHIQLAFPEGAALGELHQLSFSLNQMLRRLERDRSRLEAATAELARTNKELLRNQQEMIRTEKLAATGRLAAGLAHEIGNPLGVVQGYLELMQMPDCSASERVEYCTHALKETARMHALISSLLETARSQPKRVEQVDMHALISEFAGAMQPQGMLKGIKLRLLLEAENAVVTAADDSMRQVLLNAVLNAVDAIHATGAKEGLIELRTRQLKKDGLCWFEICMTDTGSGLRPEHAGKIFDPFFSTKEPGAGTGLGLSVSLALVEAMGGSMHAANREGGGMALSILLHQPGEGNVATKAAVA